MKPALLFLGFLLGSVLLAADDVAKISPTDAARLVTDGQAVLVDVREPDEWAETGVAAPAVLLPKSDFDGAQKSWKLFLKKNATRQIILYCRSGRRATAVAGALAGQGFKVASIGGFRDWEAAGLPIRAVGDPAK